MMEVRFKMVCFSNIGYFDEFVGQSNKMKNLKNLPFYVQKKYL